MAFSSQVRAQDTETWNDLRVGLFVHWGLYSCTEGAWNGSSTGSSVEWIQHGANIHSSAYSTTLRPLFTPSPTWATDLAAFAKASGMEYVMVTAKHHDGFTLFNSPEYWSTGASNDPSKTTNPYGGSNISPSGRDLMLEIATAVRAQGLKFGFYYSVIDWQHPNAYRGNNGLPRPTSMSNSKYDENSADPDPAAGSYKSYIYNHIEQLLTNYGVIDELWFDYSSSVVQGSDWDADALMTMIRTKQPNIMVNNRLYAGLENPNGDFGTPERTIPAEGLPFDWETAQSWDNGSWGYRTVANGANYKTAREAVQIYAEASSKGGNTLLNVGPNRFGNIPPEQVSLMNELGTWMATNGEAVKETRASGIDASNLWGRMTKHKSGNRYYAIVFDRPSNGVIDITSVTHGKVVTSIAATRLTPSGPVSVPITFDNGSYTVSLDASDLDSLQSATFCIDLVATDLVDLPNLAAGKTTSSSSVYQSFGLDLHGGLAVDGDYSAHTDTNNYNMFHSATTEINPWFIVDLGNSYRIREVVIYNRSGFESVLRDITIEILDASDNVVATYADLNDGNILNGPSTLRVFLQSSDLVSGNKIRVSRESDPGGGDSNNVLTITEIEVFGFQLADTSLNGSVDQADIDLLATHWGAGTSYLTGDVNGDGQVNQMDLTLTLTQWNDTSKANLAFVPAAFLDTDADRLDDNWELIHFGNTTTESANDNNDGDEYNNLQELAFGGDPTTQEQLIDRVTLGHSSGGFIEFIYQRPKNFASLGIDYQIETSPTMSAASWTPVASPSAKPPVDIDGRNERTAFDVPISGLKQFYRLRVSSQDP
ncbi:MAG: alpha-L-fucosidase [Akkermansiaceae bacterium]